MTKRTMAMDGFSKVKPIGEGYVVKGGVNATSRITTRPPPPQAMKPASSSASPSAKPKG